MTRPRGEDASQRFRRHLDVKLKEGWRYDEEREVFLDSGDEEFSPEDLPARTRIVHMTPELAEADPATLTEDERNLARYVQVVLPESERPDDWIDAVRKWPCVAEARLPPTISLPRRP